MTLLFNSYIVPLVYSTAPTEVSHGLLPNIWRIGRPHLHSADHNVAVGFHGQYIPTLTAAAAWRTR